MRKLLDNCFRELGRRAGFAKLAGIASLTLAAAAGFAQPVNDNFAAGAIIGGNFGNTIGR